MSIKQICAVDKCNERRTSFKKSAYCAPHTCRDIFCKKPSQRLEDYCPEHGGSRFSSATATVQWRPTVQDKPKPKVIMPDYSICRVQDCKMKKTPYKRSDFCASHTCQDAWCKNPKWNHPKFCDLHKCDGPGCTDHRYTNSWPGTTFCLYHACNKCHRKLAVLGPGQFKFCTDCGVRCKIIGCDLPTTHNDSRFCEAHLCGYVQCDAAGEKSYKDQLGSDFCKRHRCKKCAGLRTKSTSKYCQDCQGFCAVAGCHAPRPSTHDESIYYCNDHGCLECHAESKHVYQFHRQTVLSDHCKKHTTRPSLLSPYSVYEMTEWPAEVREAASDCNRSIKQKADAERYNLTCPMYCSDGYCRCEMMPFIYLGQWKQNHSQKMSVAGEEVYLLSDIAHGEEGRYAWTIPITGTGDMITFELVAK